MSLQTEDGSLRNMILIQNVREILAAYVVVQSFTPQVQNKHLKLMVDNTTAVAVMNHMDTNHTVTSEHIFEWGGGGGW